MLVDSVVQDIFKLIQSEDVNRILGWGWDYQNRNACQELWFTCAGVIYLKSIQEPSCSRDSIKYTKIGIYRNRNNQIMYFSSHRQLFGELTELQFSHIFCG